MIDMRIPALRTAYRNGSLTLFDMIDHLLNIHSETLAHHAWISPPDREALLAQARDLETRNPDRNPLWGIPFAVKDNIDIAGWPTTAACRAYTRTAAVTAPVVQALLDAGAILVGKTNLDQFASGLNGTRSDYGICRNAFDPAWIAGGSSSGSAVAVALGMASFSLGTDTAGSGRVPAAFNNLVGLKPTRGLLSTRGLLPACRSIDCMSIFALDSADASTVLELTAGFDAADPYSRGSLPGPLEGFGMAGLTIGIPHAGVLEGDCDSAGLAAFARAAEFVRQSGARLVEIEITPFLDAAHLLYGSARIAERYVAIREFFDLHADAIHPVVRDIIAAGEHYTASQCHESEYALAALRRNAELALERCDALLLPTTPAHYRVDEILADPITTNNRLGTYTNFVNLLDLCAVAVPAGLRSDGMPVGVTLLAPAFSDRFLLGLSAEMQPALNEFVGCSIARLEAYVPKRVAPAGSLTIALVGAHMQGLALNHEMRSRGAYFMKHTRTSPRYRLYVLEGTIPRPALVAVAGDGAAIDTELWAMPESEVGSFLAGIPSPLGLGKIGLEDGSEVIGFICELGKLGKAEDITRLGGWRAWLAETSHRSTSIQEVP
jgi:allophanate hydrolase